MAKALSFCKYTIVLKNLLAFFLNLEKPIIIIQPAALLVYLQPALRRCIYTLQHISEDGNFYLVCRQNRSLTLPLHCNTCYVEDLNHENLSLCIFSTFSIYHGRTCLLFLSVLSPFFQITVTQPHSKSFYIEPRTLFPQRH